eukprot:UC1_evm2s1666
MGPKKMHMMTNVAFFLLVVLPLAVVAARPCVFCDAGRSYDLSALSTETFVAYTGTPGSTTDPYVAYYVTSPCGSVETDMCISGPTSDPIAKGHSPVGLPICEGLGSLNDTYGPLHVAAVGDAGVTITMHGRFEKTSYNVACDPGAPVDGRPTVEAYKDVHGSSRVNVSWRHPAACRPMQPPGGCAAPAPPPAPPRPKCEGCLPGWRPTWNMSQSTALYGCNSSGPLHNVEEAAAYGIMVYDWSHAKLQWANSHPMNDDAHLLAQAEAVLAVKPGVPGEQPPVWVYRNKIKALNWIGQVREKLDDPAYAGWFVRFKDYKGRTSNNSYHVPACDWYGDAKSGPPKCSGFYHDQGQVPTHEGAGPAYCRPSNNGNNVCRDQCDCGATNPCGEYTFDHRNASFAKWWVDGWMISKETLLHDPPIGLGWLDDGIGLTGVSELSAPPGSWVLDTGSSPSDMQAHVDAFHTNIARLQRALVERKGFYWQMIQGTGPKIRPVVLNHTTTCHEPKPRQLSPAQCATTLRKWCTPDPEPWQVAHLYFVCASEMVNASKASAATAEFLLTRGDFAWIGYTWAGCFPMPIHDPFRNGTWLRPRPVQWDTDYGGRPAGPCAETAPGSGVFQRAYPKAKVTWDCNTGTGDIQMH